jgi:hypothetical protein
MGEKDQLKKVVDSMAKRLGKEVKVVKQPTPTKK